MLNNKPTLLLFIYLYKLSNQSVLQSAYCRTLTNGGKEHSHCQVMMALLNLRLEMNAFALICIA